MSAADSLKRIVGAVLESFGVRYYVLRRMRVESQNADGTLELSSLDRYTPGLSNVPIYQLTPGSKIKVPYGAFALVGFENGDPDKRYALSLWAPESGQGLQLILQADDLQLGGAATEQAILGTAYRTAEHGANQAVINASATAAADLAAAAAGLTAMAATFPTVVSLIRTLAQTVVALNVALTTLENGQANYLSTVVKVRKS